MQYMKSLKYSDSKFISKIMGPNPLKLLEELMLNNQLAPHSRVCDLGSGQGLTSLFLAKEYNLQVYAADLWSDPQENQAFFDSCQMSYQQLIPVKADAENLPFERDFFDGVVSVDSYNYFGRSETYLDEKLLPFVKKNGLIYLAIPGTKADYRSAYPPELLLSWTPEQLEYMRDINYWKNIFMHSQGAELLYIKEMEGNEELWADWIAQDNPYSVNDRKSIEAGACQYLTFLAVALRCK